ncbi:MAG: hypothetical protein LQ341_000250 [Variospora aurantia]|nr:MAG: hypothetical protein LQ341_000250 [Variospora aurantia]
MAHDEQQAFDGLEPHVASAAGGGILQPPRSQAISADEIALLRSANLLLVGMRALANEIAKNLMLAGIGSLTILDHHLVTEDDLGSQLFISELHVGMNRAAAAASQVRALNPRVALSVDMENILLKPPEFYSMFDLIIATDLDLSPLSMINAACRFVNKPFYAAGSHGMYGFVFADLITHEFVIEREKSNLSTTVKAETMTRSIIAANAKDLNGKQIEMVTKREIYSPINLANTSPLQSEQVSSRRRKLQVSPLLTCLRALWEFQALRQQSLPTHSHPDLELFTKLATEKHKELQLPPETLRSEFLRSFLQNVGSEIAPVTAFLGGQVAQDIINVLGQREQPIQNFLLFDSEDSKGPVYALHPIFPSLDGRVV